LNRAASEKTQDRSLLLHLISENRFLVNENRHITFVKTDRSQNRVSHCLATDERYMFWSDSGSKCILQVLDQDLHVTHTT
jgi:hypothetical protein